MRRFILPAMAALVVTAALPASALAVKKIAPKAAIKRKPDLADFAAGTYQGRVVADARGSSGTEVVVTVRRVAKNMVELSFDYARVPTVRVPIQRAGDAIIAGPGRENFLVELNKDPKRLDLSIDGVTMVVRKS